MRKIKVIRYQCSLCKDSFDTEVEAKRCENSCKERAYTSALSKLVYNHNKSTNYTTRCFSCEKILIERDSEWDGHRNSVGDITYHDRNYSTFIVNKSGYLLYCCHECLPKWHKIWKKFTTLPYAKLFLPNWSK